MKSIPPLRFRADGPAIPGDLVLARDEGRVIFFCGAGVSRAKAGLPDFLGLTDRIINELNSAIDSPSRKLLEISRREEIIVGAGALVPADRIFSLLEREFDSKDIHLKVAEVLKPGPGVDLSAHRTILDLARGPDGRVRLVTTNFDRLFEDCDPNLTAFQRPHLPDPERLDGFNGVVHLHGAADEAGDGWCGDGFILSSADFGRAYLSEGWATTFVCALREHYVLVFVGYAADDPPVQYLLEALHRSSNQRQQVYAFQEGSPEKARALWEHKGVTAIAYDVTDKHRNLWETLECWAERVRDTDSWYKRTLNFAAAGPEFLQQHERGQIAHIVSTEIGARKLANLNPPISAEWLCVFDKAIRFGRPGFIGDWFTDPKIFVDPFQIYGLDSDPTPKPIDPKDYHASRDVPSDAWDCFAPCTDDLASIDEHQTAWFHGNSAVAFSALSPRLRWIGIWLSEVSHQPTAVWWAAERGRLHPVIQDLIHLKLQNSDGYDPAVYQALRYLLDAWNSRNVNNGDKIFEFSRSIKANGWSGAALRRLAEIWRPYLVATRPNFFRQRPPKDLSVAQISFYVGYPSINNDFSIPDMFIPQAVRLFRGNLDHAIDLEIEIGQEFGCGLSRFQDIPPIDPDPKLWGQTSVLPDSIYVHLMYYISLMARLIELDAVAARREVKAWRSDDDTVFSRLRIWAGRNRALAQTGTEVAEILHQLSEEAFWHDRHQRDLLLCLRDRWPDFSDVERLKIGQRLLSGHPLWNDNTDSETVNRRARSALRRIDWLISHGCWLNPDLDQEIAALRALAPDWQPALATEAADSLESRGGWVQTNTDETLIADLPLALILDKSEELAKGSSDFLLENKPFSGLATKRPKRALAALSWSAKRGRYPAWAWREFLSLETREADAPRLMTAIAERLSRLPTKSLIELIHYVTAWLHKVASRLLIGDRTSFERLFQKLIDVVKIDANAGRSAIVRRPPKIDWAFEALNAPIGHLAEAQCQYPDLDKLLPNSELPLVLKQHLELLLYLPSDLRRHALVRCTQRLDWFYQTDPEWTERHLLCAFDPLSPDQEAAWAGLIWRGGIQSGKLFIRLKENALDRAKKCVESNEDCRIFSSMVLRGWASGGAAGIDSLVSDQELRNILLESGDPFRQQFLWHLSQAIKDKSCNLPEKALVLLNRIWPRQTSAKSAETSGQLCRLAFASGDRFPEYVAAILPLVRKIGQRQGIWLHLDDDKDALVSTFPDAVLDLLDKVLPEDTRLWPYGTGAILDRLTSAKPTLAEDSRMVGLKRRWDSR